MSLAIKKRPQLYSYSLGLLVGIVILVTTFYAIIGVLFIHTTRNVPTLSNTCELVIEDRNIIWCQVNNH